MEKVIESFSGKKPSLLLHACCAPCASACVERLKDNFDITLYFYNPNMDGEEEYSLRRGELEKLKEKFGVKYIVEPYGSQEFYDCISGLEKEKEGGARCKKCFELRLKKTADKADADGYDYFATTLTVSPLKNSQVLNQTGDLVKGKKAKYLPTDFKKKGGYLRSIELSNELGLYRQNYCGCEFSKTK